MFITFCNLIPNSTTRLAFIIFITASFVSAPRSDYRDRPLMQPKPAWGKEATSERERYSLDLKEFKEYVRSKLPNSNTETIESLRQSLSAKYNQARGKIRDQKLLKDLERYYKEGRDTCAAISLLQDFKKYATYENLLRVRGEERAITRLKKIVSDQYDKTCYEIRSLALHEDVKRSILRILNSWKESGNENIMLRPDDYPLKECTKLLHQLPLNLTPTTNALINSYFNEFNRYVKYRLPRVDNEYKSSELSTKYQQTIRDIRDIKEYSNFSDSKKRDLLDQLQKYEQAAQKIINNIDVTDKKKPAALHKDNHLPTFLEPAIDDFSRRFDLKRPLSSEVNPEKDSSSLPTTPPKPTGLVEQNRPPVDYKKELAETNLRHFRESINNLLIRTQRLSVEYKIQSLLDTYKRITYSLEILDLSPEQRDKYLNKLKESKDDAQRAIYNQANAAAFHWIGRRAETTPNPPLPHGGYSLSPSSSHSFNADDPKNNEARKTSTPLNSEQLQPVLNSIVKNFRFEVELKKTEPLSAEKMQQVRMLYDAEIQKIKDLPTEIQITRDIRVDSADFQKRAAISQLRDIAHNFIMGT